VVGTARHRGRHGQRPSVDPLINSQYSSSPHTPPPTPTGPLEATGVCKPGDVLTAINDVALPTPGGGGHRADVARLRDPQLAFPCRLAFLRPSTGAAYTVRIPAPPRDGQWGAAFGREEEEEKGEGGGSRPVLRGFRRLPGPLARRGLGQTACRPGRVLLSVNGTSMPDLLRRIRKEVVGQGGGGGSGGGGGGGGVWAEVEPRLQAVLEATPLPASLVVRDMEAFAAMRRWRARVVPPTLS
jgi:hypothetical protein